MRSICRGQRLESKAVMSELAKWDTFYVIVGSAAGALIGLQFVVLTLIVERPTPGMAEAGAAFGSPTIVHFGVALLHAPWQTIGIAAAFWGVLGFCGVIYAAIVARRMRGQVAYKPQLEDRIFHLVLPVVAYATLVLTSVAAWEGLRGFCCLSASTTPGTASLTTCSFTGRRARTPSAGRTQRDRQTIKEGT